MGYPKISHQKYIKNNTPNLGVLFHYACVTLSCNSLNFAEFHLFVVPTKSNNAINIILTISSRLKLLTF